MKNIFKLCIRQLAKFRMVYFFLKPLKSFIWYFEKHRTYDLIRKRDLDLFDQYLYSSLTVLNGPFKGLKYVNTTAMGSTFLPKIVGSYEKELHPIFSEIINKNYTTILDIGCAEGYYAVGLARIFPDSQVYAYDIDTQAQLLCREMAINNGVDQNMFIQSEMTSEKLAKFKFHSKSLIICDCEGYEMELFNSNSVKNLSYCDLLIETHDFIDLEISENLKRLLKPTHEIISILTIDDIQKAHNYNFTVLDGLSKDIRVNILAERRPSTMEWIWCKARLTKVS
tara:strand:- start:976 stop:1821 length:846 start_codon:yes stop_codon:yes gene_type:complete